MRRIGIAAVAVLIAAVHAPSRAEDQWRYCVAQDEDGQRFYITEAFPSGVAIEVLERSFNVWLDRTGQPHRWGICPRSATAFDAAADVESAVRYNRKMGLVQQSVSWPDERS